MKAVMARLRILNEANDEYHNWLDLEQLPSKSSQDFRDSLDSMHEIFMRIRLEAWRLFQMLLKEREKPFSRYLIYHGIFSLNQKIDDLAGRISGLLDKSSYMLR